MTYRTNTRVLRGALLCAAAIALANCGGGVGSSPAPNAAGTATPTANASSTPGPGASASAAPVGTKTPAPGTSNTPAPGTSSTPAPGTSSRPAPGTSSTPAPGASSTPTPGASSPPTPGASSTPGSTGATAADGIPYPSATDPDPFYAQPNPFPNSPHGTILASRPIMYMPNGAAMSNAAYQIKFVSQDINGKPIAAVAAVVKPTTPAAGNPVFVEAFPEDALGSQCAPSHWATGSMADSNETDETTLPNEALQAGYTLVVPDIEGPFSLYAVARQEGYIVLDAEQAALNFAPLGLNAKTMIGASGYSGGAHAVSWAAALQPSYAPNLNLVGTASGGTPADLQNILENIDGTSASSTASNAAFFSIIYMSAVGINRGFPNFITPILNAKGIAAAVAMENGCIGKNTDGTAGPAGHFADYVTVSNPFADPHITSVTKVANEPQPGLTPRTNVFIYQSVTDELIPVAGVDKLVMGWCAAGSTIEYYRANNGGDHVTMETQTESVVLSYMSERFNGLPLTLPSGQTTTCN